MCICLLRSDWTIQLGMKDLQSPLQIFFLSYWWNFWFFKHKFMTRYAMELELLLSNKISRSGGWILWIIAKMWELLKNPRMNEISHVAATSCYLYTVYLFILSLSDLAHQDDFMSVSLAESPEVVCQWNECHVICTINVIVPYSHECNNLYILKSKHSVIYCNTFIITFICCNNC